MLSYSVSRLRSFHHGPCISPKLLVLPPTYLQAWEFVRNFRSLCSQISKSDRDHIEANGHFPCSLCKAVFGLSFGLWFKITYPWSCWWASQVVLVVKNPFPKEGDSRDMGFLPALERSPGGGHGNPLQYSCLKYLMDRGAWWATVHRVSKTQTRLSDFTFTQALPRYVCQDEKPTEVRYY